MLAGMGKGFTKLLQAADNREPWAFWFAGFMFVYSAVFVFILWREWGKYRQQQSESLGFLGFLKSQIPIVFGSMFGICLFLEIVRRLIG